MNRLKPTRTHACGKQLSAGPRHIDSGAPRRPMPTLSKPIRPLLALAALGRVVVAASGCGTTTADVDPRPRSCSSKTAAPVTHWPRPGRRPSRPQPRRRLRLGARSRRGRRHDRRGRQGAGRVPAPQQRRPAVSMPPTSSGAGPRRRRRLRRRSGPASPARRRRRSRAAPAPRSSPTTAAAAATRSPRPKSGGTTGPNLDEVLPGQTAR